ncbi:dihydroneopterin aldolase [Microbacterium endophyticum]|uniref:7,8-dihydroneopterin aldolase n=1 Tax=Microbacterium endophyticum TaxID=1526412 RepID=A0A7W4V541_9MICO|nr:dihydroneopterin aldolase [Microbacterium endophyticum]MBB2976889.1 dihydroneopterin aldolase [Microbacterium endophyticum]NIK35793.1 dihydroneopterin aldolase [Microbacterium endophyticum]
MNELDEITLTGLRGFGFHGVYPDERRDGQEFIVDVTLALDTRRAAASDDVTDTVHYGEVADDVVAVITGAPVDLIETLAARIADVVLQRATVQHVRVTVHKPSAPITVPFTDVTLTIARDRTKR